MYISTHSLTKRLTDEYYRNFIAQNISTHSLTKRLTRNDAERRNNNGISTHSLTKRLTVHDIKRKEKENRFQLTASRRGWPNVAAQTVAANDFNSQPHEEADYYCCSSWPPAATFQLTASRRGWQFNIRCSHHFKVISTHSLTKRLTTWCRNKVLYFSVFQLTASRRGWLY